MGEPHVLAMPFPAQSHVISLLEFAQCLVSHGIKVTFVNTDFNHCRILESLSESDNILQKVNMVSIPDGVQPWEDRDDIRKFITVSFSFMPGKLEDLILRINGSERNDEITCVVADVCVAWAFEVADKLGIRSASYCPASAAFLSSILSIPSFIQDGIIDSEGKPLKDQVELSPAMPVLNTKCLPWRCFMDELTNNFMFDVLSEQMETRRLAKKHICNSSISLEPGEFSLLQEVLSVGPLMASNQRPKATGHFWKEESACLAWLDQQPLNSVIYIAFGSFTVFDHAQFEELAMGIELTNRPFLWVVRQGIISSDVDADNAYPKGFKDRTESRGRVVKWAPQQEVLSHPSIACFLSHCGWNSTIEGIANGVPFLCWPYFGDQFLNESYICDEWEIGLGLCRDESGIIRRGEIKDKVERLLSDHRYKMRAMNLQEKTMDEARKGWSNKNFHSFVDWINEK